MLVELLFTIIWCLCYAISLDRIDMKDSGFWGYTAMYVLGPLLHIVVLLGFGITGYMKKDWENLM